MPLAPPRRWERAVATSAILTVLLLQSGVVVARLARIAWVPNLWPFLDYPMYRIPRRAGDLLDRYRLIGVTREGDEVPIEHEDLGMDFWKFKDGFVMAVVQGRAEEVARYAAFCEQIFSRPFRALRVENHPVALTRTGLQPLAIQHWTLNLEERGS
jgi:hypothetical protein